MTFVQGKLSLAEEKWKLRDITKIYAREGRAVFSAEIPGYGTVIIKINSNLEELHAEYHALHSFIEYNTGKNFCEVVDFDADNFMLIEEQIIPGTPLRMEKEAEKRIHVFTDIFRKIHCQPNEEARDSYSAWLERACTRRLTAAKDGDIHILQEEIQKAKQICLDIFYKYPERMLLHGDLHHDNILMTKGKQYLVIDPKGVSGPEICDIPRFLLNELSFVTDKEQKTHIYYFIQRISEILKYPKEDIIRLFFMEVILSNCWNLESGVAVNEQSIVLAVEMMSEL